MRPLKHLSLIPLLALGLLLLAWLLTGLVLDPYGNFRLLPLPRYFEDHVSTPWRYAQDLRQGDRALVFGTSHSATYGQADLGEPLLNLSTSVYGFPSDILAFLQGLDEAQWAHVSRVYLDADFHTMRASDGGAAPAAWHSAPAFYWAGFRQTRQLTLLRGLDRLAKALAHTPSNRVADDGTTVYGGREAWDGLIVNTPAFSTDPAAAADWGRIAALLKAKGKEAVFFDPLKSEAFWRWADLAKAREHYHLLLAATGPVVELGWEPRLSRQRSGFRDGTHREKELLDWEAAILRDPRARERHRLDAAGLDTWLAKLEKDLGR